MKKMFSVIAVFIALTATAMISSASAAEIEITTAPVCISSASYKLAEEHATAAPAVMAEGFASHSMEYAAPNGYATAVEEHEAPRGYLPAIEEHATPITSYTSPYGCHHTVEEDGKVVCWADGYPSKCEQLHEDPWYADKTSGVFMAPCGHVHTVYDGVELCWATGKASTDCAYLSASKMGDRIALDAVTGEIKTVSSDIEEESFGLASSIVMTKDGCYHTDNGVESLCWLDGHCAHYCQHTGALLSQPDGIGTAIYRTESGCYHTAGGGQEICWVDGIGSPVCQHTGEALNK